ncbi:MAG: OmpA family protein [Brevinematales bacterium]|jgi:chemotaxis protein MotB
MKNLLSFFSVAFLFVILGSCSSMNNMKPDDSAALRAENQSLSNQIIALNEKIMSMSPELNVEKVTLVGDILFDEGSDVIKPEGKAALDKIVKKLTDAKDKFIRIEGYTDDLAIAPAYQSKYPSNWELSSARANAVLRYLIEKGVKPEMIKSTGYGKYNPVASNDTTEGRAQNRRIEVELVPMDTRSKFK